MRWEILAVIVAVLGVAAFIEYRRVPQVREWAIRHGYDVTTNPGGELQAAVRSDSQAFGTRPAWGFGLVLTREGSTAHVRISEQQMPMQKGTAWHVVVSIQVDGTVNQAALRVALQADETTREVAIGEHGLVWRRRGLLWPKRLEEVSSEVERLQGLLQRATGLSEGRS